MNYRFSLVLGFDDKELDEETQSALMSLLTKTIRNIQVDQEHIQIIHHSIEPVLVTEGKRHVRQLEPAGFKVDL